jgi:hypothetical protein
VCSEPPSSEHSEDVSVVLQRLATRQKRRQYSATVSGNVLNCGTVAREPRHWCDDEDDENEDDDSGIPINRISRVSVAQPPSTDDRNGQRFSGSRSLSLSSCHFAEAGDVGSGVKPASDQHRREYNECQKSMIEQSRALLEQSKAKHHALVAQAHTMQKRLRGRSSISANYTPVTALVDPAVSHHQQTFTPKPPTAPHNDRKSSAYRAQRMARLNTFVIKDENILYLIPISRSSFDIYLFAVSCRLLSRMFEWKPLTPLPTPMGTNAIEILFRGKLPTQIILENHGCKFAHSLEMAVKPTCVCMCNIEQLLYFS